MAKFIIEVPDDDPLSVLQALALGLAGENIRGHCVERQFADDAPAPKGYRHARLRMKVLAL